MKTADTFVFPTIDAAEKVAAMWRAQETERVTYPAHVRGCEGGFLVASGFVCSGGCSPMRPMTKAEVAHITTQAGG